MNILILQRLVCRGRRSSGRKVFYSFLDKWKLISLDHEEQITVEGLVNKISTRFTLTSFSKGGVKYQVPQLLSKSKSTRLAFRWLINQRKRGVPMAQIILSQLLEIKEKRGALIKRREDIHKAALSNQRFFRLMKIKRLKV